MNKCLSSCPGRPQVMRGSLRRSIASKCNVSFRRLASLQVGRGLQEKKAKKCNVYPVPASLRLGRFYRIGIVKNVMSPFHHPLFQLGREFTGEVLCKM
ncbi:hypothetical protein AVEN_199551-1 [Araneus ventricosus]|uniref:Uncharacterized protein n=1 Tax=Araneus ventricosus TaxID=182803 RepID=A0A4Y2L3F4_ARAVE|nr:hypothetical protein AVEN_199551-1 [Araneus ventricosus]